MRRDWYVVQLKPNGLRLAKQNLIRQGIDVFCPLQETLRRRQGKVVSVRTLLFPGYAFVALTPDRGEWHAVNNTRGVLRLVILEASKPRPAPEALIEALQMRCSVEGVLLPETSLEIGETVRLVRGPMAGQISRIEALAPEQRIWVLLDLMGRATRVAVKAEDVERH